MAGRRISKQKNWYKNEIQERIGRLYVEDGRKSKLLKIRWQILLQLMTIEKIENKENEKKLDR